MKRRIGTLAVCGALLASAGVPANPAVAAGGGASEKCELLLAKYMVALDKGQNQKAKKLKRKLKKNDCAF